MYLFSIDNVDYTEHIKVPTYNVNNNDVYEEWKDANYREHRDIVRTQMSGSFTMIFVNQNEYLAFLKVLKDSKGLDGTILASFYSNNTDEVITSRYFIDYEITNEMPFFGNRELNGINISIKEQ